MSTWVVVLFLLNGTTYNFHHPSLSSQGNCEAARDDLIEVMAGTKPGLLVWADCKRHA